MNVESIFSVITVWIHTQKKTSMKIKYIKSKKKLQNYVISAFGYDDSPKYFTLIVPGFVFDFQRTYK